MCYIAIVIPFDIFLFPGIIISRYWWNFIWTERWHEKLCPTFNLQKVDNLKDLNFSHSKYQPYEYQSMPINSAFCIITHSRIFTNTWQLNSEIQTSNDLDKRKHSNLKIRFPASRKWVRWSNESLTSNMGKEFIEWIYLCNEISLSVFVKHFGNETQNFAPTRNNS